MVHMIGEENVACGSTEETGGTQTPHGMFKTIEPKLNSKEKFF